VRPRWRTDRRINNVPQQRARKTQEKGTPWLT
jgi:hypothetical protein